MISKKPTQNTINTKLDHYTNHHPIACKFYLSLIQGLLDNKYKYTAISLEIFDIITNVVNCLLKP